MEIINKKLEEIKIYEKNPRKNDDAVEGVANSIKEFGFKVPIIIDKNNVIVAGHTRYKASQKLGLIEVPCIVADDLTEEQVKAFRLADNKTNEKASWDLDLLGEELKDILNLDMTDFGFNEFEITALTEDTVPDGYDDELIEKYSEHADDFLEKKRTIITYKTEEEENFLKELFKADELKVVYDVKEIMESYE